MTAAATPVMLPEKVVSGVIELADPTVSRYPAFGRASVPAPAIDPITSLPSRPVSILHVAPAGGGGAGGRVFFLGIDPPAAGGAVVRAFYNERPGNGRGAAGEKAEPAGRPHRPIAGDGHGPAGDEQAAGKPVAGVGQGQL